MVKHRARSLWGLDLSYFDGRCEALIFKRHRRVTERCGQSAAHDHEGHAVCRFHKAAPEKILGYDPDAAWFRWGHLYVPKVKAIPPEQWDF